MEFIFYPRHLYFNLNIGILFMVFWLVGFEIKYASSLIEINDTLGQKSFVKSGDILFFKFSTTLWDDVFKWGGKKLANVYFLEISNFE